MDKHLAAGRRQTPTEVGVCRVPKVVAEGDTRPQPLDVNQIRMTFTISDSNVFDRGCLHLLVELPVKYTGIRTPNHVQRQQQASASVSMANHTESEHDFTRPGNPAPRGEGIGRVSRAIAQYRPDKSNPGYHAVPTARKAHLSLRHCKLSFGPEETTQLGNALGADASSSGVYSDENIRSVFSNGRADHGNIYGWTFMLWWRLIQSYSFNSETRWQAANKLGSSQDPRAGKVLIRLLTDSKENVRSRAAWALGRIRNPNFLQPLITALVTDPEDRVKEQCEEALKSITPDWTKSDAARQSVPNLIFLLRNGPHQYRAAHLLGKVGGPSAIEELRHALNSGDKWIRVVAASGLGENGDVGSVNALLALARGDQSEDVIKAAISALGKLLDSSQCALLRQAFLEDVSPELRVVWAGQLARFRDAVALKSLAGALFDEHGSVRKAAAEALPLIDPDWRNSPELADLVPTLIRAIPRAPKIQK